MSGLLVLGRCSDIASARTDASIGAWSDGVTDYDYGELKVIQLVQFFNALGRPKEFEADVERVYTSYEKTKAWEPFGPDKLLRWKNATQMKMLGADAAVVMDTIRASGAHGDGKTAASSKVPTQIKSPVYEPDKDKPSSWLSWIPWWGWTIIGVGSLGAVAIFAVPPIISAVAASRRLVK